MALIDDIEFYGRAVAAEEMTRATAVEALVKASDGGLTPQGAGESIDNWRTARGKYRQAFGQAARTLDKIYGLDDIQP
jgi:hypothetical protein